METDWQSSTLKAQGLYSFPSIVKCTRDSDFQLGSQMPLSWMDSTKWKMILSETPVNESAGINTYTIKYNAVPQKLQVKASIPFYFLLQTKLHDALKQTVYLHSQSLAFDAGILVFCWITNAFHSRALEASSRFYSLFIVCASATFWPMDSCSSVIDAYLRFDSQRTDKYA